MIRCRLASIWRECSGRVFSILLALLVAVLLATQIPALVALLGVEQVNHTLAQGLIRSQQAATRFELIDSAQLKIERIVNSSFAPSRSLMTAGRIHLLLDQTNLAASDLAIAMESIQHDEIGYWLFGTALAKSGRLDEAINQWSRGSNIAKYFLDEADLMFRKSDFTAAQNAYQLALDVARAQGSTSYEAAGFIGLGSVAREEEDWDVAITHFRSAVDLAPEKEITRANLAHVLLLAGRLTEACSTADQSIAQKPNWLAHLILGECAFREGDLTQAATHFVATTQLNPENPWGWHWLGLLAEAQGDSATAQHAHQRAAAIDPAFAIRQNDSGSR